MKFCSRIFALILIATLLISALPFAVFADYTVGTYTITTESLRVRSGPSTSYSKIGNLTYGQSVSVTEVNGEWGKISYNGSVGWISLEFAVLSNSTPGTNSSKKLTLSAEGLQMIKNFEGYRQYKYWDGGHYSIGYGSTCGPNDYPNGISEAQASALLVSTMASYEANLDKFLSAYSITVSQKQYDALVSFTYNFGNPWTRWDEFELKTILINGADKYTSEQIRAAFGEFVKANGVVLSGLVYRRNAEADMFIAGTSPASTKSFKDVYDYNWYFDAVEFVNSKGMMTGVTGGYFEPEQNLNRAMMVTILAKIEKIDVSAYKNKLYSHDVKATDWFAPYVAWAYESGITKGTGNGYFSPYKAISRQDFVVMLYNYTTLKNINTSVSAVTAAAFDDQSSVSDYARVAMNWAVGCGCITGNSSNELNPKGKANRAVAAQIIMNYTQNVMA